MHIQQFGKFARSTGSVLERCKGVFFPYSHVGASTKDRNMENQTEIRTDLRRRTIFTIATPKKKTPEKSGAKSNREDAGLGTLTCEGILSIRSDTQAGSKIYAARR